MGKMTITEAAKHLGVARITLERRLKRLKILPKEGKGDQRYRYVSDTDIEQIRIMYASDKQHDQRDMHLMQTRSLSDAHLHRTIAALEAELLRVRTLLANAHTEVALLKSTLHQNDVLEPLQEQDTSNPVISQPEKRQRRAYERPHSHSQPLPAHLKPLDGFCLEHGLSPSTIRKAILTHRLPPPITGLWLHGKATVKNALDTELQAMYLLKYKKMTVAGDNLEEKAGISDVISDISEQRYSTSVYR